MVLFFRCTHYFGWWSLGSRRRDLNHHVKMPNLRHTSICSKRTPLYCIDYVVVELQVNLFQKLTTSGQHVVYQNCSECQNKNNNLCTRHVLQVFWAYNFHEQKTICRNIVDAKIRASDKNLPVCKLNRLLLVVHNRWVSVSEFQSSALDIGKNTCFANEWQ